MNRLQSLGRSRRLLRVGQPRRPRPTDRVLVERAFSHPLYTFRTLAAQAAAARPAGPPGHLVRRRPPRLRLPRGRLPVGLRGRRALGRATRSRRWPHEVPSPARARSATGASRPFTYGLEHDVFYVALDLDELDEVAARLRLVGRNRRAVLAFRDADHLPRPATDLTRDVRAAPARRGHRPDGWQITLITNLRVLGYVFNPASFYLCRDAAGALRGRDRRGPQHATASATSTSLRPAHDDGAAFAGRMDKDFYVSPFIALRRSVRGPRPRRARRACASRSRCARTRRRC